MREAVMSLIKPVKWFAIYALLTLGFAAATALVTFIFKRAEFETLFFFFLFLIGAALVAVGVLIIIQAPKSAFATYEVEQYLSRKKKLRTERKDGMLLILVGLTFVLVPLTQF